MAEDRHSATSKSVLIMTKYTTQTVARRLVERGAGTG